MMEKVKFEYNEPQTVTLKHAAGKIVDGKFGAQVYFTLADGRCMYLNMDVAQKLNLLEPQAGESIVICKRTAKIWDVWLSPETEKLRAVKDTGTIEQTLRASVTHVNENRYATLRVPVLVPTGEGNGQARTGSGVPAQAVMTLQPPSQKLAAPPNTGNGISPATPLVKDTNTLVDAYAEALAYASGRYGNQVKPEDVRSLLVTAYINRTKGGAHA